MSAPITTGHEEVEAAVRAGFEKLIHANPDLGDLVSALSLDGSLAIFGGFVRDQIHNCIHQDSRLSRDIDLVLSGKFSHIPEGSSRNNFGGFRTILNEHLRVDYWELDTTHAFREKLFEPRIEFLPLTTVYTLNACVFEIGSSSLIAHRAIAAITARIVAFNCRDYLHKFPQFQAFRAMDFAVRLGYRLDEEVRAFVNDEIRKSSLNEFLSAVRAHRRQITQEEIRHLIEASAV